MRARRASWISRYDLLISFNTPIMPLVETMIFPTTRYPEVYTSAGRNRYVRGEVSMIAALQQANLIEWRARDVPFCGARPRATFDAACRFPSIGVQKHIQPGDGTFVIFSLAAHVTYPCREVWHGDQFFTQPGEISDVPQMHHTCCTLATSRGI